MRVTWTNFLPLWHHASRLLTTVTGRNMGLYVLVNGAAAGISFLMLPIFTRFLSSEDYGLYAIALAVAAILFPIASLGLPNTIARDYVDRNEIDFPRLVTTCLLLCGGAFVAIVVAIAIADRLIPDLLVRLLGGLNDRLLPAIYAMVAAQIALTIGLTLLQMEERAVAYGAVRVGYAAAFAIAGTFAVLPLAGGGSGLILAKASVDFAIFLGLILWMVQRKYIVLRASVVDARRALAYGLPLIPHMVATGLIGAIDRFLLANMVDVGAAGVYMVGYQIAMILSLIVNSMNQAWLPWFFRQMKEDSENSRRRVVLATYLLAFGIAGLAALFALALPLIVRTMIGPGFQDALFVAPWIIVAFFFLGLYTLACCHLFYVGRTGWLATATSIAAVSNVLFSWLLINLNGVVGAAQGMAMAWLLAAILVWWAAVRSTRLPWLRAIGFRSSVGRSN